MSEEIPDKGWRQEFKEAWFAANNDGLLPKKQVKELWATTERAADIAYKYIRKHLEAVRHHQSPVWVKAGERLPQVKLNQFIVYRDLKNKEAVFTSSIQPVIKGANVYWPGKIDLSKPDHAALSLVEWLDEHPSSLTGDAVEDVKKTVLEVLEENYQAAIAGYYNYDKTEIEKERGKALIEEYQDLIGIFKHKFYPPVQIIENKK